MDKMMLMNSYLIIILWIGCQNNAKIRYRFIKRERGGKIQIIEILKAMWHSIEIWMFPNSHLLHFQCLIRNEKSVFNQA